MATRLFDPKPRPAPRAAPTPLDLRVKITRTIWSTTDWSPDALTAGRARLMALMAAHRQLDRLLSPPTAQPSLATRELSDGEADAMTRIMSGGQ